LAAKIGKNTQTAKFIQNLAVTTAKFIWNLAVWIVETLFRLAANTWLSYKMRLCKLYFEKIGENCRVEMAKLKKSPRKVYFGKYFSFISCGLKKMLYFCPMKKSTQSIA